MKNITKTIVITIFFIITSTLIETNQITATTNPKTILLTGYWNPTGIMLKEFSTNLQLNPNGWQGHNWEGYGYDIYAYFPEPGTYTGDFEVDYQDTWEDFWNITNQIHPYAIISFGAKGTGAWEIEYNAVNLNTWANDMKVPYQPTPNPPDNTQPVGYIRHSTLPVQQIVDAIEDQTTLTSYVDWNGTPGAYLCGYMAYLGMWYQNIHSIHKDLYPCYAAGFIHVSQNFGITSAVTLTKITLRETIQSLEVNSESNSMPLSNPDEQGDGLYLVSKQRNNDVYHWI
jgi:pyrrolidone-carboxylate peptidase